MSYKVKNLTFQPVRLISGANEIRIPQRGTAILEEYTDQMKNIEKRGLIKIREIK